MPWGHTEDMVETQKSQKYKQELRGSLGAVLGLTKTRRRETMSVDISCNQQQETVPQRPAEQKERRHG